MTPDVVWIIVCGFLVMLMQAGFTCLEGGLVRAKNSINVAIKNLVDFCISCVLYATIGFAIMFGTSYAGLFGTDHFLMIEEATPFAVSFLFFQMVFCGTATTIVSGSVAERMGFAGYCIVSAILSTLIYPVVGHWAWAGAATGQSVGWLGAMGFIDFAGSTVVHSCGGWMALAAILVIGPRLGRFGPDGRPVEGDNLPIATLGVFLLWFGWFGFNAGSTLALEDRVPAIIANTALAGAAGGLAAMAVAWLVYRRPVVDRTMNGVLAGLVGITAGCHLMSPLGSLVIGAIAGVISVYAMRVLEHWQVDDAIGAVPVHLVAGIWGTLAVALFAPVEAFGTGHDRLTQLGVQALGVVTIGAYCFTLGYLALRTIDRVMPLRVGADAERIGLNVSEHGAQTAILDLLNQLDRQARLGDFRDPLRVEPATEAASIAHFYNSVRERFIEQQQKKEDALRQFEELAMQDPLTGLPNRRRFLADLHEHLTVPGAVTGAVLYFDLDGFKAVNDAHGHGVGDLLLVATARRIERAVRRGDRIARLGGDEFGVILITPDALAVSRTVAGKLIAALGATFDLGRTRVQVGASVGVAPFGMAGDQRNAAEIVASADQAMYIAKRGGKGRFAVVAHTGVVMTQSVPGDDQPAGST